jgi:hypothetical protein
MENELISLLQEQNALLQGILNSLSQPKLGPLETAPGSVRVYCNRDRCPGALWYTVVNGEPVPFPYKAIRGYLTGLKFEQVERRGKPAWKLYTTLNCGYELESGYDSVFSKGLLSAIASLTPEQVQQPVTIGVAPGDDESVLLSRFWLADDSLAFAKWDEQTDWRAVAQTAKQLVTAAK